MFASEEAHVALIIFIVGTYGVIMTQYIFGDDEQERPPGMAWFRGIFPVF